MTLADEDFTLGSTWDGNSTGDLESINLLDSTGSPMSKLDLTDAFIIKEATGHYYVVGYLPGEIKVAGWLHERP